MNQNQDRVLKSKYNSALTEEMLNNLIRKTETSIITEKEKQSKIVPELSEAKAAYELVQEQYDTHQAIIEKEEATLAALKTMKTGSQEREVYKTISNTFQKPKPERKAPIQWKKHLEDLLREKGHFVKFETLLDLAMNKPEIRERRLTQTQKNTVKYLVGSDLRLGKAKNLTQFRDKVGLSEWFTEGGELKPQFLKDFMG